MIEGRPKSSRDMSNDNNLIQFRNQAISYKRPKSSKNIKNLNQN